MVTVNVSTIGSGGDYATIALWEAATDNDLVALDRIEVGELLNQTHSISSAVTITGATTDATHYRILRAAAGAEYDPARGTGAIVDQTADTYGFLVAEEGFRLEYIGVKHTVATHGATACVAFTNDATNSGGVPVRVTGVTAIDETTTHTGQGFWVITGEHNVILNNCVVIGKGANSFTIGFRNSTASPQVGPEYNNCVAYDCTTNGFQSSRDIATFKIRNCVAVSSGTADFSLAGTTNAVALNNASSDATATGPGAVTGIKPHRAFIAYPLNDFRPQADGPLHQAGVNLSSSFTQDITQNAYGAKWNIGPYGQSVRNGNSRANDTRILQVVFASGVDWAFIDTRGYDYMLIYPIGGVGTDPTSGTITFGAFAVDSEFTVSDITDPGERAQWASMPNIAGIHRQATMTSTAVNFGYMKVLPTRILLWASGGSGWSNVPVRVELHRANEHWTEAGRG